eukprot:scaffold62887_cov57-Phaeocystis_antarctica.AAC.1
MKRQRPEAAGDRLALADQSGCDVSAQFNGKARALPACDGKPFNHDGSATAEEAGLHAARTPGAQASAALPPPMTAGEALAQTEAEGLTLARSDNESGYRNVFTRPHSKVRPYEAKVWRDSKHVHIGCFDTAEEAALHVARTPEAQAAAALPPPMTAEEALAQAEAEGLTLVRSSANQSGFCNVGADSGHRTRPYKVCVLRDGKTVYVGHFATAEEAALHVARTSEAQAAALPPPMTAAEAVAQAEAEGLTLAHISTNQSGFRNVSVRPNNKVRPYEARGCRDGKHFHIGCFATAEEAALHVARTPEAADRAALPPPMTAAEALAQAEAEGLALARSDNQSGFRNVSMILDSKVRPYEAKVWRDGKMVYLGSSATAEEAALHVARTPEAQNYAALPPPMTAEEALAQAEAEGLTLARSDNQSGFRNVGVEGANIGRKARPYDAKVYRDGKNFRIGCFATAEEAALHVARTPEGRAAASAAVALPPPMTAEEALAQVEAEGLTLARSDNQSGFFRVSLTSIKTRPYAASVWRDGKAVHLGYFVTPEEAALY